MGLVGESGSGKSTIAYTVMGMYRQTDGEIIFNGQTITNKTKGRSKISAGMHRLYSRIRVHR